MRAHHDKHAAPRAFPEGSKALVLKSNVRLQGPQKLLPPWLGPFRVIREVGNTCQLELPPFLGIHPRINKSHLRIYVRSARFAHAKLSVVSVPAEVDAHVQHRVQRVVGERVLRG